MCAIAYTTRGAESMLAVKLPLIENTAPTVSSAAPAVSGETPLPNVTGPLLDPCGNVAAYSLAHDVQTMSSHPGTRYKWRETLLGVLSRMGIPPAPTACRAGAAMASRSA